ncbi:MAG: peptide transporter [Sulfolobaceae archaeon]|nr:peptide transporter [Sulfolobaceae archaeon]
MQSLKSITSSRISKRALEALIVSSLALVSMLIRALSTNWPLSINGFDSWYLFYNALLIASAHGNWYAVPPDVHAWFPWGYAIELGDTIGLPFIVALFSLPFYSSFGANAVYTVTLFMDIALAGLGVLAAYLAVEGLTKSKIAGYIAAAIIAVSPSLTYKNIIGGLPKTSWGGVFVLFSIYLLDLAIKKDKPIYSIVAGIILFLAEISWGGYTYIDLALIVAAFLIILLNKNSETVAKNYSIMAIVTAFLTSLAPNNIGFMSGLAHGLSMLLVGAFLYLDLYLRKIIPEDLKDSRPLILSGVIGAILVVAILALGFLGLGAGIPARYFAIINPFFQYSVPIDRTVAEYIPQSITAMIEDFGVAIFLSIMGIYYILRKPSFSGLWLVVLGAASILGTSEQPYLFNYTAYMVAALAGVGVYYIISAIGNRTTASKITAILFLAFIGLSLIADGAAAVVASNAPNAIYNSATSYVVNNYAWVSALDWIRTHTPQHSFILSWWDYGYWIEVVGNRTVIDENNTLNGTQIRLMAEIFLNNETFAVNVLEKDFHLYPYGSPNYTIPVYIVAYDAVTIVSGGSNQFEAFLGYPPDMPGPFLGYTTSLGDIAKAMGAMTIIAGYNQTKYVNITELTSLINSTINAYAQINPTFASELISQIESAEPLAWTSYTYNTMIADMFIEGLQVAFPGIPVIAPFTATLSSSGQVTGTPLPTVMMNYFQPVYVSLSPLTVGGNPSLGGIYRVYIMVVVYQFVQPGTIVSPTVVVNS